jgi:hypothetical protein
VYCAVFFLSADVGECGHVKVRSCCRRQLIHPFGKWNEVASVGANRDCPFLVVDIKPFTCEVSRAEQYRDFQVVPHDRQCGEPMAEARDIEGDIAVNILRRAASVDVRDKHLAPCCVALYAQALDDVGAHQSEGAATVDVGGEVLVRWEPWAGAVVLFDLLLVQELPQVVA